MTQKPTYEDLENRIKILEKELKNCKRVEETLQQDTTLRLILFENAPDGILIIDPQTSRFLDFNRAAHQQLGYSREEFAQLSILDVEAKETAAETRAHIEKIIRDGKADFETLQRTQQGDIRHVHVTAQIVDFKGQPVYHCVWRDITERKLVEAALRESEEKFRKAFQTNTGAITISRLADGMYVSINDAFTKLTGYTEADVAGKTSLDLNIWENPTDRARLVEGLRRDGKVDNFDAIFRKKDGNTIRGIMSASVLDLNDIPHVLTITIDITDRMLMEEALRRSEKKYRELVDNANSIILRMDDVGNVTFFNEFAQTFFGYREDEIVGKNVVGTIVPRTESTGRNLKKMIEHIGMNPDQYINNINENTKSNGERVWIAWTNKPRYDEHGKVKEIVCIGNDITERKQAQDSLRESQQQLADIINFLPDATIVIDHEGKVIAWNKAIEQMTRIPAADMLGKGDYEYALPFYGKRRPILIDLVLNPQEEAEAKYVSTERSGNFLYGEAYMPALKGGEVYLSGKASALLDSTGNIIGAIESIRDITDRRKAEEKYKGIFENAVMGIFQASSKGKIISANPACARILGYESPEELIDTTPRQLFVNLQDYENLVHIINEHGTIQGQEVQFLRKDGHVVWVYVSGRTVHDGTGKLLYYEGTIQDITDRMRLESQLRQAQKMEAIGTLAGGIAHDFNNMLAAIMGFTEMIQYQTKDRTIAPYLEQILKACNRSRDLVKQILTFSRQREQEKRPLSVTPIVKEAMKLLRSSIPTTINIRQQYNAVHDTVLADPTQIHQVMMNLCTNAAYAMRGQEGILTVILSQRNISSYDQVYHPELRKGTYLQITVRDTGEGIDPSIKDRIFDPFFTTKELGDGTGLGLSVVYGIVKDCGGAISVDSGPGKGTAFTIHLPLIIVDEILSVEQKSVLPKGTGHILYIDDEEPIATLGRDLLTFLGYDVTVHLSSLDALEVFRAAPQRFDLVITDMTMPSMTGVSLARELLKIRPLLPIILTTGYSEIINEEQAKKIGIREFLMKPISIDSLAQAVKSHLDRDKSR